MADPGESSPLIAPVPVPEPKPGEIDLEAGPNDQFQCRIVSRLMEGFAFSHCTTCKAPYYLTVQVHADRKWRLLKFCFFVTRNIFFIFGIVQHGHFCSFPCSDYRDASLLVMIVESTMIWLSHVENYVFVAANQGCVQIAIFLAHSICGLTARRALKACASTAGECGCLGGAGEAGLPLLFIMGLIILGLFTIIGIFYSILVATMAGQRIWQRHYHILAKRMLTKEYVVEDVDGEDADWSPPPLPPEHIQQLKSLARL